MRSEGMTETDELLKIKSRAEAIEVMKTALNKGFRYVVRDPESEFLNFYSSKPKKFRSLEAWGYPKPDEPHNFPVAVLRNVDITEISWTNRYPTLIEEYIKKYGEEQG